MWLVGVVSRMWVWVESMSVTSGCGCKEVYIIITYPCSFLQQHPYLLFIFLNVFRSCSGIYFCNLCKKICAQYKHTDGRLRASHCSHTKGCTCFIREAHTNERFISCDGHQLYAFKWRGVDLEVEGVCYNIIEMHRGPHTC